ncbi:hypothetical protein C8R47DRAFT_1328976 [Mycena vitilis]|nr:hypothetical protein C8R47DRAFT_1328976 [Mycena vitilis]
MSVTCKSLGAARLNITEPYPPRDGSVLADQDRALLQRAPPRPDPSPPRPIASHRTNTLGFRITNDTNTVLATVLENKRDGELTTIPNAEWDTVSQGRFETRAHILQECPRYDDHRDILRKASATIHLPDILGTKEGIAALADFIEKSGAFTKTGAPRPARTIPTFEEEPEAEEVSSDGETDDEDDDEDAA